MIAAAIIRGVFVDLRTLPSRGIARVTVEIPIEAANDALAKLGGFPLPSETRWVAVALLAPETDEPAPPSVPGPAKQMPVEPAATAPSMTVGGRPWRDLKFAQQAGIMCSDSDFQAWLGVPSDIDKASMAARAAAFVRQRCGVTSRAELDTDPDAAERWIKISHDFFGRLDVISLEQSLQNGRH